MKKEKEQFTVEERAKFLHDTIAARRRFLAEQRAITIRNKPPIRTQLRNQMMTYLKHVRNKKHSDLKSKTFEEIQALYEKVKRFDESFNAVGSTEDERRIKEMNEGVNDTDQKRLKEEDIEKVPAKVEVTERGTLDSEIMEKKSVIARLDKVTSPDGDYLVIYRANVNFRAFNYLMEGDLKIMMESSTEENDQSDFWNGIVIHMLVERRYPLSKDLLQIMLDLGLEVERESTVALDLIRSLEQIDESDAMTMDWEGFQLNCFMVRVGLVQDSNDLALLSPATRIGKDKLIPLMVDSLPKTAGPLRNVVLTSIWYTRNDLCAAYTTNNRAASNRATVSNDSSKSIPSCWLCSDSWYYDLEFDVLKNVPMEDGSATSVVEESFEKHFLNFVDRDFKQACSKVPVVKQWDQGQN
ncbi:hypothetical protein Tco_1063036 [Tanacetum coccineum]